MMLLYSLETYFVSELCTQKDNVAYAKDTKED